MAAEVNPPLTPVPKTSLTIPLVLVLSIFSLAISGYLFWQNQQLMKQLAAIQKPTAFAASPSPAESPDPTAEWKTYENPKYGFIFKYPSDWKVKNTTRAKNSDHDYQLELEENFPNSKNGSMFQFTVFQMNVNNLERWIINHSPLGDEVPKYFYLQQGWYKKANINGLESVIIESKYPEGKYAQYISVIFSKNNTAYDITLVNPFPDEKLIFEQILSTFKFTE